MTSHVRWLPGAAWLVLVPLLWLAASAEATVTQIDFPFDSVPTGFNFPGSVSVTSEGLTITLAPDGTDSGFVDVLNSAGPGEADIMGQRSLFVRLSDFSRTVARFTFSQPVSEIDFGYYDQGGDDDGDVIIKAYDPSGNLLDTFVDPYGTAFGGTSGLLPFTGATSFTLETTGSGNPNSLGWSVRSVIPVPEPSPALLLASGLVVMAVGRGATGRCSSQRRLTSSGFPPPRP